METSAIDSRALLARVNRRLRDAGNNSSVPGRGAASGWFVVSLREGYRGSLQRRSCRSCSPGRCACERGDIGHMSESGIVIPFAELPQSDQDAMVGWLRDEIERERQLNPWIFAVEQYPDGSLAGDHATHEMRLSVVKRLNEAKAALYLPRQRNRAAKLEPWAEAVKRLK